MNSSNTNHQSSLSKEWKTIPINKISFERERVDIVKVKTYKVYGKKHTIIEFNGSFFIPSNAGNIHTCLEMLING